MRQNFLCKMIVTGLVFAIHPFISSAGPEKTAYGFAPELKMVNGTFRDTVPEPKKSTNQHPPEKPAEIIIKEVPRSRKQVKPIAFTPGIQVKPVRMLKPKIIKPVIKIH